MQEEIWKDVPGYEGSYQVSNLGRVKSLDREVGDKLFKSKVLNLVPNSNGYYAVGLYKDKISKKKQTHQLVAMAFLNHNPDGYNGLIVDHIDNNPLNNRLSNLQLISARENSSKDKKGYSSKYIGVSWNKQRSKWISSIEINGKHKYLGIFNSEEEASEYYQDALISIENNTEIKVKEVAFSSKYKGVSWDKSAEKWKSQITINGKSKSIGSFKCEIAAAAAYQKELIKLNK